MQPEVRPFFPERIREHLNVGAPVDIPLEARKGQRVGFERNHASTRVGAPERELADARADIDDEVPLARHVAGSAGIFGSNGRQAPPMPPLKSFAPRISGMWTVLAPSLTWMNSQSRLSLTARLPRWRLACHDSASRW
jgi:hypothetical protein